MRGYGPPLTGEQFREVKQLLLFFSSPFRLLNTRVQPLKPARLALLGGFLVEERGYSAPLVRPVLHNGCLQYLILCVAPHPALYKYTGHYGAILMGSYNISLDTNKICSL